MKAWLPGVALQAAALVCVAVAYSRRDGGEVEGAYFNRAVGEDAAVLAFDSHVGPWLIAAGVLILLSIVATIRARR